MQIAKFNFLDVDMHYLSSYLFLLTGELGSLTNVYKASLVSMMAGSDFVKTSTGKESVNATFPVALVMVRAVRDYYQVIHVWGLFLLSSYGTVFYSTHEVNVISPLA